MNKAAFVLFSIFLVALLAACGGAGGSEPSPALSGTVFAPPGGDVSGTVVAACYQGNCDDERSQTVAITQSGASAPYRFDGLEKAAYGLGAVKDVNGNGEVDVGDYGVLLDAYQTPPAKVDLKLEVLADNDGGGGNIGISGTLTAPAGGDIKGSVVVACYQNNCQDQRSHSVTITQSGSSAPYSVDGLEGGVSYSLLAYKDVNGNKNISLDDGDYLAQAGPVTAPAQNVAITLQSNGGGGEPATGGAVFPDLADGTNGDGPLLLSDTRGTLHLLYTAITADDSGVQPVRYGTCSAGCSGQAGWTFVTVGDVGFWGGYGQVALDADGHPRVLYFNREDLDDDGRFVYASCDDGCTSPANWTRESLSVPTAVGYQLGNSPYFALAPDGTPAFVYIARQGTYYAYRGGSSWKATRLDEGGLFDVSLTFTSASKPRLTFHYTSVDNESYLAYLECRDKTCQDYDFDNLPATLGYRTTTVLRLNADDAPRALHYTGETLQYLWCNTACTKAANWSATGLGTKAGYGEDGIDLVLDGAGRPHISYGDSADTFSLYYGFCSAACESAKPNWQVGLLVEASDDVRPEPPLPTCNPGETPGSYWYADNAPSLTLNGGQPSFAYRVDNLQGCGDKLVGEGPSIVRFSNASPTASRVKIGGTDALDRAHLQLYKTTFQKGNTR